MSTDTPDAAPSKMGRPSTYSSELSYEICGRLAEGQSLRAICSDPAIPDKSTVLRWVVINEDFRQLYTIARDVGVDALADEALADATAQMRSEDVQAARLAFDARRWYAGKIAPKRWGDKVVNEHTGADGGPVQLQAMPTRLVPTQVAAGIKALLTKAEEAAGIPTDTDRPDAERLTAILASDKPMDPDLYEAIHGGEG